MKTKIFIVILATIFLIFTPKVLENKLHIETVNESVASEDLRAEAIDMYFMKREMPLVGYGSKMVEEADKNKIDWRLLPAIAVRESSGGKQMCGNNPFGWGSCRLNFDSIEKGIEIVAWNLGGNNPKTSAYYSGGTHGDLVSYNGTVVHTYPEEVMQIMGVIGAELDKR